MGAPASLARLIEDLAKDAFYAPTPGIRAEKEELLKHLKAAAAIKEQEGSVSAALHRLETENVQLAKENRKLKAKLKRFTAKSDLDVMLVNADGETLQFNRVRAVSAVGLTDHEFFNSSEEEWVERAEKVGEKVYLRLPKK